MQDPNPPSLLLLVYGFHFDATSVVTWFVLSVWPPLSIPVEHCYILQAWGNGQMVSNGCWCLVLPIDKNQPNFSTFDIFLSSLRIERKSRRFLSRTNCFRLLRSANLPIIYRLFREWRLNARIRQVFNSFSFSSSSPRISTSFNITSASLSYSTS